MQPTRLYTIGYGNRTVDDFVDLAKSFGIELICDVRSTPYSSRFPDFAREALTRRLKAGGISYEFMGDLLGARPSDPELYDDGRASYAAMARSSAFTQGIEHVEADAETRALALMCAEKDPMDCHRAILIARVLDRNGIEIQHIDAKGKIESQRQLESRLLKRYKLDQTTLFSSVADAEVLERAFEMRGHELAYVPDSAFSATGQS